MAERMGWIIWIKGKYGEEKHRIKRFQCSIQELMGDPGLSESKGTSNGFYHT
jgi:hypothetical protein